MTIKGPDFEGSELVLGLVLAIIAFPVFSLAIGPLLGLTGFWLAASSAVVVLFAFLGPSLWLELMP